MYDISHINIGEKIRKYRKIKHLSLEYVGEKIFKKKATISKYEKGEIIPDFVTVLEICNVLDIDLSTLCPSILPIFSANSVFNSDTLYLYYLTGKKLITSIIKLQPNINDKSVAFFYNGVKENADTSAYYYEGIITYSDTVTYMSFRNTSSNKLKTEEVQITITQPLSNANTCYNCFVSGLTPNFIPIIKRGLISTIPLTFNKSSIKKLQISKKELQNISDNNAWLLNSQLYDEFFYDLEKI